MTYGRLAMSRPRAAISVATSTLIDLFLNPWRARSLAPCDLFPCMALEEMPALSSLVLRRLAPCLVLVKTSTWFHSPCLMRWMASSALVFWSQRYARCSTRSAVVF